MIKRVLSACGLVLVVATMAVAQGTTSRLAGQVTDSTGAVLPGVTVTLTNDGTGVSFSTVTTAAGAYVFEALPSGSYTVKFELQGFKTLTSKGNRVAIGQPTSVDAQMAPGELSETVQVTGRDGDRPDRQFRQPRERGRPEDPRGVPARLRRRQGTQSPRYRADPARRRVRREYRRRHARERGPRPVLELHARRHRHQRDERGRVELLSASHEPGLALRVQDSDRQYHRRVRSEQRRPGGDDHPIGHEPVPRHRVLLPAQARAQRERMGI